jgi:hypothetical protein
MSIKLFLTGNWELRVCQSYFTVRERKKDVFRRTPVKRTHGESVILAFPHGKLLLKIIE